MKLYFYTALITAIFLAFSCSENTSEPPPDNNNAEPPVITKLSVSGASIGDRIIIYGKNFGKDRGSSYAEFNTAKPHKNDYIKWGDTMITVLVPDGATTGDVTVSVGNKKSNGEHLDIFLPIVECTVIYSGSFSMGSNSGDELYGEKPTHNVTISYDFAMSIYEITQDQYDLVTGGNPSQHKDMASPVEQVTWLQALRFCNMLSAGEGRDTCYNYSGNILEIDNPGDIQCNFNANGYRLPTEAEWEYAARAGSTGDYAGNIDELGWTNKDNVNWPQNAGLKKPNTSGLYDMHGNVWEWCWDAFDSEFYSKSPAVDPRLDPSKDYPEVILRGGSYIDGPESATSWKRYSAAPGKTIYNFNWGFRVVRKK